jgi:hypothetical protein
MKIRRLPTTLLTAAVALALCSIASAKQPGDDVGGDDDVEAPVKIPTQRKKIDKSKLKRVYTVIKAEPTIKQVQNWALRYHDLDPDRVKGLQRNARLKGLFPEVEAGLDNSVGNSFTNTRDGLFPILPNPPENPNPDNFKERVSQTNDNLTWRVRAVWSLDKLVFNSESLDAMSLTSLQENLVREVTTLYFARRRLIASMLLSPPSDELELFFEMTRLDELTATVDGLTGGKFADKAWNAEDAL